MPTSVEAPHHLSVGATTVGGSTTLNVYLYLVLAEILAFFFAEALYSNLSVFFFIPLLFGLPGYAIYDIVYGVIALIFNSSYSYYTAGTYFFGAAFLMVYWVCLPLLFIQGLLFGIPNWFAVGAWYAASYVFGILFGTTY